jgi:hypothetical protein
VKRFSSLVDQLVAYEVETNPLYYAMRFIDGMHEDTKSMVMLHWPANLDAACVLALVQEEAGDAFRKKEFIRYVPSKSLPPLAVPLKLDKSIDLFNAEDKRTYDVSRVSSGDDKVRALKQ